MTFTPVPDDTIAAAATAAGGAIGIVRISGPEALAVAARVFCGRDPRQMPGFTAARGFIEADGRRLDEALCLVMRGPKSYTREDVVELHCHGGSAAVRQTLAAVISAGARPAEPGEFTRRAFLNGRIDLAQAEAVADLVAGETAAAARAAAAQLCGGLSERVGDLRSGVVESLALLEAAIDFPEEEDIPDLRPDQLGARLHELSGVIGRVLADADRGRRLREGARVVIAGRPNVGKSSLMNALLRQDRVIVSAEPGTTRDVVEDGIELGGVAVRLYDTAGLRKATGVVEELGVTRAHQALAIADLTLLVLDGSAPLSADDHDAAQAAGQAAVIVINKADLPAVLADAEAGELLPDAPLVRLSALTGANLGALEKLLAELLAPGAETPAVTNARHAAALADARRAIDRAAAALESKAPPELVASDLRSALAALGLITGETATDEALDLIFSRFCIGK